MLYLIGLGLNEKGIPLRGIEIIEKCDRVYLENYTADFPYDLKDTEASGAIQLGRGEVESDRLINESKKENVALLVYGAPLFATTHISLVLEARKAGIPVKIISAGSIFDAVAETGLQLYKFGKIGSMPAWTDKYKPEFLKYIKENQSINAHSLILTDVGMPAKKALEQLEEAAEKEEIKIDKLVVGSKLGTRKRKIFYDTIENLKKIEIKNPFCFVIPGEMHFLEKEALEIFRVK